MPQQPGLPPQQQQQQQREDAADASAGITLDPPAAGAADVHNSQGAGSQQQGQQQQPPERREGWSSRKTINRLLMDAPTIAELQQVVAAESGRMDGVNASHALYRLAKLATAYASTMTAAGVPLSQAMPAVWDRLMAPCIAELSAVLASAVGELEARDVATSLWAYATLGHYDRRMFDLLCAKAVMVLHTTQPVDCANIMVAFARFGHYHPEVVRMIPQVLLQQIYETKPYELSQVLWGYGRLRIPGAPGKVLLSVASDALMQSMDQFRPQELSTMLCAFVKLGHYPGKAVLQRAESLTMRRLRQSSRRGQQQQQRQYQQQQHQHQHQQQQQQHQQQQQQQQGGEGGAGTAWGEESSGSSPSSGHSSISNDGLGEGSSAHKGTPAAVGGEASSPAPKSAAAPGPSTQQQQAQLQGSFAQGAAGFPSPAAAQQQQQGADSAPGMGQLLMDARSAGAAASASARLMPAAALPLQTLVPQDISNLLWAFGKLRFKAVQLLDELPLYLGPWLQEYTTADLCCVLAGYTNARHYHRGVLEALASLLAARARTLNVTELVVILWSYGIFQHRPLSEPHFLDLMSMALTHQLQPSMQPQTYSLIIKAYANLKYWPEAMLTRMVEHAETRLHSFQPEEMAALLYGLSHLAASKHVHQLQEQQLQQVAGRLPLRTPWLSYTPVLPAPDAEASASSLSSYEEECCVDERGPVLSPPLSALFHSFLRQCIRRMEDAEDGVPDAAPINYKVLNSIVFSCLRVGQSPMVLIDYAESRGVRLIQPAVAVGKLRVERQSLVESVRAHLAGRAGGPQHSPAAPASSGAQRAPPSRWPPIPPPSSSSTSSGVDGGVSSSRAAAGAGSSSSSSNGSSGAGVGSTAGVLTLSLPDIQGMPPPRARVTLPGRWSPPRGQQQRSRGPRAGSSGPWQGERPRVWESEQQGGDGAAQFGGSAADGSARSATYGQRRQQQQQQRRRRNASPGVPTAAAASAGAGVGGEAALERQQQQQQQQQAWLQQLQEQQQERQTLHSAGAASGDGAAASPTATTSSSSSSSDGGGSNEDSSSSSYDGGGDDAMSIVRANLGADPVRRPPASLAPPSLLARPVVSSRDEAEEEGSSSSIDGGDGGGGGSEAAARNGSNGGASAGSTPPSEPHTPPSSQAGVA